jgi:hypothetical protein
VAEFEGPCLQASQFLHRQRPAPIAALDNS